MTDKIRLRLAPSPTGFLHIGNLRTALFGFLLAKSKKGFGLGEGKFILRIEDTDQKREVAGAVDSLINILDWAGINFDEGPVQSGDKGPYVQSERQDIYNFYAEKLLAEGGAYRCFCTEERLKELREKQSDLKQPPRYDGHCRNLNISEVQSRLATGDASVIRQKMPQSGEVEVVDMLRGTIKFQATDLEDHVLVKSNGVPTYHFASVVDDHLMEISHVTRGEEWLPSFPKNILLYQSFGWTAPRFIHLPLILNPGGGKLSKRQGDVFVEDFRAAGYLPEAIINFCAMLGWHDKSDRELFTLPDLLESFNFDGMGASPSVFDLSKLDYLNGYYIRQKSIEELAVLARPFLAESLVGAELSHQSAAYLQAVITTVHDRLKKLSDITEMTKFYFVKHLTYSPELLAWKTITIEQAKLNLQELLPQLAGIKEEVWDQANLEGEIFAWLKANDKKVGDYLWPLRVALTGEKFSPGPFEVLSVLGKALSLARVEQAIV
jgi:glutamyl-tRNA synthetase